ncbi:hypothetical protein EF847_15585 [Actinobacteria bacterium YIM 96077]|uniref:Pyrrolo-quinoline quinone n=1 Tax=Phytoactinopolyspora halophila TaxID=1981511 RepID=A0A329QU27_9ACTN|nr:PQQ-binding-like beta-propeller repeat protein [Phytoactinopolyspora halophila]AYY13907.1 hypothetical protein EF847_15585 [Actinobacteria bacterium YIM 96077]RAW15551.1 hypothetical protein DPM12_07755 [Phytoactinopolyspora halophila]
MSVGSGGSTRRVTRRRTIVALAVVVALVAAAYGAVVAYQWWNGRCEARLTPADPDDAATPVVVTAEELDGGSVSDRWRDELTTTLQTGSEQRTPWEEFYGALAPTIHPVALTGGTLVYQTEIDAATAVVGSDLESETPEWAVELAADDRTDVSVLPAREDVPAVVAQAGPGTIHVGGVSGPEGGGGELQWCLGLDGDSLVDAGLHRASGDVLVHARLGEASRLTRLDGTSGENAWSVTLPDDAQLVGDAAAGVQLTFDGVEIVAVDVRDGSQAWSHELPVDGLGDAHLVGVSDGWSVVLSTEDREQARSGTGTTSMYALGPDGEVRWREDVASGVVRLGWALRDADMDVDDEFARSTAVVDGTILVAEAAGDDSSVDQQMSARTVHGFDLHSGQRLWSDELDADVRLDESVVLDEGDVMVPLGGPLLADERREPGMVLVDVAEGAISERYLPDAWVGNSSTARVLADDSYVVLPAGDTYAVFRR